MHVDSMSLPPVTHQPGRDKTRIGPHERRLACDELR